MKTILLSLLGVMLVNGASAAVPITEKAAPTLPAAWSAVAPAQRLQSVRAAQVEALRLLAESVYGVKLDADTCVHDFVLAHDRVEAASSALLRGAQTGEPKYLPDGRVEVVGSIHLRDVIRTLKTTVQSTTVFSARLNVYTIQVIKSLDETKLDRLVEVTGSSALAGSEGESKLQAKRAAEIDAYRLLAERVLGLNVTSQTLVRDLALKSDRIRAQLARVIRGAEYQAINLLSDGTAEVTFRLALADVDHLLRHEVLPGEPVRALTAKQAAESVVETGRGAAKSAQAAPPLPTQPYEDVVTVINRVVERQVVLSR